MDEVNQSAKDAFVSVMSSLSEMYKMPKTGFKIRKMQKKVLKQRRMNDMDDKQLIDDLEKESMLELEVMHESENTDNERIIEDAKSKIEKCSMICVIY